MSILEEFQRVAEKAIVEYKSVHGLPTKNILAHIKKNPEKAISDFYDHFVETAQGFKKRDPGLISGTCWMRSKKQRDELWKLMERCRDLALEYAMN